MYGRLTGAGKGVDSSPTQQAKNITKLSGAQEGSQHSIDEDEKEQFILHINAALQGDVDVELPITDLFTDVKNGVLLLKLINTSVPDAVDERVINKKPSNAFHWTENNNLLINTAKAIGLHVVNIGSQDLIEGRPHLVLGLVWQIIKRGLLGKINLQLHPELYRLLKTGETLEEFLALTAEEILVRWVNYHLKSAGHPTEIHNLSSDIKDSVAYTVLLNQLAPEKCPKTSVLRIQDLLARAEQMLQGADRLGCRKYVTAKSIVSGNPRLNLAFVANLFNQHPGLAPLEQSEKQALDESLFSGEGSREARAFTLWMNSLGVEPFVNDLFKDLRDGLVLLQVIDYVYPGLVRRSRVNARPSASRFKCIENTNYIVELGTKELKFSLVGIQGADLTDGNQKLTLGLVWQLMRGHVLCTLGPNSNEEDILRWANQHSSTKITSFKDSAISDGRFLANLLNTIKSGSVDFDQWGSDNLSNAKYVINVSRKLGAALFLLPEDIVECRPKMVMTLIGTLMSLQSNSK